MAQVRASAAVGLFFCGFVDGFRSIKNGIKDAVTESSWYSTLTQNMEKVKGAVRSTFNFLKENGISGVFAVISQAWSDLKAVFENNAWMKKVFFPVYGAIRSVDEMIDSFSKISQWWGEFSVWFAGLVLFPNFEISTDLFEPLKTWWLDFKNWLGELDPFTFLGDSIDYIKDKLSLIPGINFNSTSEVKQKIESEQTSLNSLVSLPGNEPTKAESEGGLFQTFSNLFSSSSKQNHVEKIEVNNYGQGVRGDELAHEMEMQVG